MKIKFSLKNVNKIREGHRSGNHDDTSGPYNEYNR